MCVTIKNTTDGCHNKQKKTQHNNYKKRKLADIVRLDFNKYVVRTTNPVTIPDDEGNDVKRLILSDYLTYDVTAKNFC